MTGLKLRSLFRRRLVEQELDEELRYHIERQIEDFVAKGLTPEEARYAALRAMGGLEQRKEECRDARRVEFFDQFSRDVRYGLRSLRSAPVFTTVAILTLALTIGANTAIFSIVYGTLLRPLPYPNPEQLLSLESVKPAAPSNTQVSPADFKDWREQSKVFAQIAASSGTGITIQQGDHPETLPAARVTGNFFDTLNVRPALGRGFTPEDTLAQGPPALVISHRLWMTRFGGNPAIVGKPITTDGSIVVGVMPPDFKFPRSAEAWVPLPGGGPELNYRSSRYWRVFGRLRSGQTAETAQAEMRTIAERLADAYPKDDQGWSVRVTPLADTQVRNFRPAVLTLMGAVSFVLLIACANVSGLMLARSAARRREVGVRLALGATQWHLLRQFIIEGLILSLAGAIGGLFIARWSITGFFSMLPGTAFSSLAALRDDVQLSALVMLFTAGISMSVAVLLAVIPALQARRVSLAGSLHGVNLKTQTRREHRIQKSLVVVQFACAVVLLAGAALLAQSFLSMLDVDYGFDPNGLVVQSIPAPQRNRQVFLDQLLEKLQALPEVESASLMSYATFGGLNFPFNIVGAPLPGGDAVVRYSSVSADYFRVLKARLAAGREFNSGDSPNAPGVAIVNETLARQFFRGENPIGRKIEIAYANDRVVREIVGVARDIRQDQPRDPVRPEIFVHWPQLQWLGVTLVLRTTSPPARAGKAIQEAIWSLNKTLPVPVNVRTVEEQLANQVAEPRLYSMLFGAFAAAAVFLAVLGIYGLLSYIVNRKMHEMAIRMAIGARSLDVLHAVTGEGMRLSILGIVAGLLITVALTRFMKSLLFAITPTDPSTLIATAILLLFVALLACYIPARRATSVDPSLALRNE